MHPASPALCWVLTFLKDAELCILYAACRRFHTMDSSFRIEALQSGTARGRATESSTARMPPRPRNNSADEPFIAPAPSILAQITPGSMDVTLSKRQEAAQAPPVKIQVPSIFKTMVRLALATSQTHRLRSMFHIFFLPGWSPWCQRVCVRCQSTCQIV